MLLPTSVFVLAVALNQISKAGLSTCWFPLHTGHADLHMLHWWVNAP